MNTLLRASRITLPLSPTHHISFTVPLPFLHHSLSLSFSLIERTTKCSCGEDPFLPFEQKIFFLLRQEREREKKEIEKERCIIYEHNYFDSLLLWSFSYNFRLLSSSVNLFKVHSHTHTRTHKISIINRKELMRKKRVCSNNKHNENLRTWIFFNWNLAGITVYNGHTTTFC